MAKAAIKKKGKKPATAKLSPQDALRADHDARVRAIFRSAGFRRVGKIVGKSLTFKGTTCDLDEVFIFENVLAVVECTTTGDVSTHLKKKKIFFDLIQNHKPEFVQFLSSTFSDFKDYLNPKYKPTQYRVVVIYASRFAFASSTKAEVPGVKYLDYNIVRYLQSVGETLRRSSRFELFAFLGLSSSEVGEAVLGSQKASSTPYDGSLLPEEHSNFGDGYKVVSCYLTPEAVLKRAYVLRRDGWRAGTSLYQRMVSKAKIDNIRTYLREEKRVFINNIIVTLPPETKILDEDGDTVDAASITTTSAVSISIPDRANCVGIIDGQHRVFAYYEGGADEPTIEELRQRQNLLVTGIIFPEQIADDERVRFEANLFLEINSTQATAKSDLKQEIALLLRPFSAEALAKRVVNHLNDGNGPLADQFERYFYDADKMKTTSVVSYAMKPLVRPGGEESLFKNWSHPDKGEILEGKNDALLAEYVQYCASEINKFLSAVRSHVPNERWTPDKKVPNRFLTTTHINGCLSCIRRLSRAKTLMSSQAYAKKLAGIDGLNFSEYKSSQYNKLGQLIYEMYF
ncbi:MAG: DGQHR domain-containing protein [Parcubacteria group bacterium]